MPLRLFEAFGVELEYMLVDAATLDVAPVVDRVIAARAGEPHSEIEALRAVSWSNELVAHVVEIKTTEPRPDLSSAAADFAANIGEIHRLGRALAPPVRIMPGAMHPWMDPRRETVLWPHEYHDVYANFHRLFDCRRHGWANLQSVHLNLPFDGDEEFARLHAAVRIVLPLLPALCAASPVMDGRLTGVACNRLEVYRANQSAVPSLSGRVIPEPVFTRDDYQRVIMDPIARDVARLDGSGLMKPEWMNSRGAIARFDRGSVEIRVMDVQECPRADLAIVRAVVGVLRWLAAEGPCPLAAQRQWGIDPLVRVLDPCIRDAGAAEIADADYLRALGFTAAPRCRADHLWAHLLDRAGLPWRDDETLAPLRLILDRGTLAQRIAHALGGRRAQIPRSDLTRVYGELCDCAASGRMLGESPR